MTFHKFAALVCVSFLVLFGVQKREASKEVRSTLFKQVMTDVEELRKCMESDEGGLSAAEEKATVEEVDLNRDGVPEYEVGVSGGCACGTVNCAIYLYRQGRGGYELILDGASGYGLDVLKTSTNGYLDVLVTARNNAATASESTYKFDGKQYRETSAKLVNPETGESKPAYRRVQFKRGTSSATLTGKVNIAMPDMYIVGARAGQVMTVQLTAQNKTVRFMLMSPTTKSLFDDMRRSWSGTLSENGDYTFIIEGDAERGATYSLTVSIK
jgi:hypothetical protein